MRLFIANPLPKAVKKRLADLSQPIEGVRWQKGRQYHLTLKFLGETDESKTEELKQKLGEIDFKTFSITLDHLGYFPRHRRPKVLWVGIKESEKVVKLYEKIEEKCVSIGFKADNRTFRPHITLARTKSARKRDVMSFINEHKQFRIPKIAVNNFVLYQSKLHSDGAKHIRLKTFPFKNS